jgi:ABC-type Fe3+-siderophore transport system permease subunit
MNILPKFFIRKNSNRIKQKADLSIIHKNRKSYNITVIAFLTIILIIGVLMSISIGSTKIPLSDILSALKQGDQTLNTYTFYWAMTS